MTPELACPTTDGFSGSFYDNEERNLDLKLPIAGPAAP